MRLSGKKGSAPAFSWGQARLRFRGGSQRRSPAVFRQAFELLISYPAQEISYTKLLGQLQDRGNVELIKHCISLYEGAYLIKTLEKFSPKEIKVKSSSPKIIPLAPALAYLLIRLEFLEG